MATVPGGSFGYEVDTKNGDVLHGSDEGTVFFAQHNNDQIFGGLGDDYVTTMGKNNFISTGDGNDVIDAYGSNDLMLLGAGDDVVMTHGAGRDVILAGAGDDQVLLSGRRNFVDGGTGDDYIQGGAGGDTMLGGAGHNTLVAGTGGSMMVGGSGDTMMVSGAGNDVMIGGSGHDTFVFNSNGGRNTVMGFNDGDILQIQKNINGLRIESAEDVAAHVTDHHGNAVITLGNEQITLIGVKAEDVQNDPNGFINIH